MIANIKPYPTYKDTGVPWLKKIPANWQLRRLKSIAKINPSKSEANGVLQRNEVVTFLPMERVGTDGCIDASEQRPATALWNGFTYFQRGDVLVAKITPCFENGKGACLENLPTPFGFGSTEFHVLRAKDEIMQRFLFYQTRLQIFRELGTHSMTGSAGQQRVSSSFIENYPTVLPPVEEQAAIVRFLDYYDWKIRRYIRAKQKLIKLLEEQKQAIINQYVTGKINPVTGKPYPCYKPSGVEWLGDIPEHWEVKRCRYLFREVDERSLDGLEAHLSMSQRLGLVPSHLVENKTLVSENYVGGKLCRVGDLVLNRLKAHLGVFALAKHSGVVSPDYTVLRYVDKEDASYFEKILRSPACRGELRIRAKGIVEGFWRLYTDDFYNIQLPVPSLEERKMIIEYCQNATDKMENAIAQTERLISLLRECRTRLIADVVTGKLDVREAAEHLPEEKERPEDYEEVAEAPEEIQEEEQYA